MRKYNVVFIPKGRRKALNGTLRLHLGEVFPALAQQKESRVEEGHFPADHVHRMIAIPPKFAVSPVIGYIKERHPSRRGVWRAQAQLRRAAILGHEVFRIDGRPRRPSSRNGRISAWSS
ncbi:REP element-mobilizing transposase RayT [Methylobacterium radiotolerans]|uniref:REP element-mobilizing transposase RayT n=1 Tax=Methylobacterium radiotolerans TaxID=31998 RepID=A0ABV2NTX5_9HYPH|nr:REP element-mobilizing transposase RayT [Methylobacterium sp. PvP109]